MHRDDPLNTEEAKKLFYERYRCFYTDANNARPVDYDQPISLAISSNTSFTPI